MMRKKKELWTQITKSIESKLRKSEFNTWFSQTTLQRCDPDAVIIAVPNKFFARWINDHYIDELKKAFKRVLNKTPDIQFSFDPTSDSLPSTETTATKITDPVYRDHNLNQGMTFNRFVDGKCNRFAFTSAREVANSPTTQYNPLVIYGKHGLGKTHLLHAIGNSALEQKTFSRVRYTTADTFTSDITYSIKNKKIQEVRNKHCYSNLFLFDDVQMLENRKRIQDVLLFIFDALYEARHQIVFTSDRAPNELSKIHPQLKSRLGCGLLAEIHSPDQETRIQIIKKKAEEDKITLSEDVVFFLANSHSDIKTLVKNLVRVETYASLHNRSLNISMVKSIIRDMDRSGIGLGDIKSITAGYFNISVKDLISKKKKRAYSYPRQLAMYLARKYTDFSLKEIGDSFGPKDHSTVVYAIRRIEKSRKGEKEVQKDLKNIEKLLS